MNDYRQNISSHYTMDRHSLYYFVRDSRLPWGTFDNPHRLTQTGSLWLVCAVIALTMLITWGAAA